MAASSAGNGRGRNSRLNTGNPSRVDSNFLAVEHNCSMNGSEVGSWAGIDEMEGGDYEVEEGASEWSNGRNKRKKKGNDDSYSEEEGVEHVEKETPENYIVIIRFDEKTQENMKKLNPFAQTKMLASKIGEIQFAKVLNDGNLLIKCANKQQVEKALKLKEMGKNKVASTGRVGAQNGGGCKGVITGVSLSVNMEELKRNIKGGTIMSVQRMKTTKEGVRKDSETVLIQFGGESVPKKVFLGFMSYPVRVYVPKPLRCFKCQRFGHIAKNCKEKRRCARCGGDHEYGECGTGVQPKCCNCGGAHNVAYGD